MPIWRLISQASSFSTGRPLRSHALVFLLGPQPVFVGLSSALLSKEGGRV